MILFLDCIDGEIAGETKIGCCSRGWRTWNPVSVVLDRVGFSALDYGPSFETRFVRLKVALKTVSQASGLPHGVECLPAEDEGQSSIWFVSHNRYHTIDWAKFERAFGSNYLL